MDKYIEFSKNITNCFFQEEIIDYIYANHSEEIEKIKEYKSDVIFLNAISYIKLVLCSIDKNKNMYPDFTIDNIHNLTSSIDHKYSDKYKQILLEIVNSDNPDDSLKKYIIKKTNYYYQGKQYQLDFDIIAYFYIIEEYRHNCYTLRYALGSFLQDFEKNDSDEECTSDVETEEEQKLDQEKLFNKRTEKYIVKEINLEKIKNYRIDFNMRYEISYKQSIKTGKKLIKKLIFEYMKDIYNDKLMDNNTEDINELSHKISEEYNKTYSDDNKLEINFKDMSLDKYIKKQIIKINNKIYQDIESDIKGDEKENNESKYLYEKGFKNKTIEMSESNMENFNSEIIKNLDKIKNEKFISTIFEFATQDPILYKYMMYNMCFEFFVDLGEFIFDILNFNSKFDIKNINKYFNENSINLICDIMKIDPKDENIYKYNF